MIVPVSQFCFEVTFDADDLDVAFAVYDVTSGTPAIVGSKTAMTNIPGTNTYFGQFTPEHGKQYTITKSVYTDGTFAALHSDYAQGSEAVTCRAPGRVARTFEFIMISSTTGLPTAGLTVTGRRTIDGAAFANCANAVAEISNGWYKVALTAADLAGAAIGLRFSATGAVDTAVTLTEG